MLLTAAFVSCFEWPRVFGYFKNMELPGDAPFGHGLVGDVSPHASATGACTSGMYP